MLLEGEADVPEGLRAGQCPLDRNGTLTGYGDLDAQIDQVVANALTALSAISAAPEHVVRSIIYVVSPDSAALGAAWRRLTSSALAPAFTTASTVLGVAQLGYDGQLIEVDLTAALPNSEEHGHRSRSHQA